MTKAPQAVADTDDAGKPPESETTTTTAAEEKAPTDATPPKKKRGRPAGSGAKAPKSAPAGIPGTVEVHLQIKATTSDGVYDFDRAGFETGEVSKCASGLIGGWFEDWKAALVKRSAK